MQIWQGVTGGQCRWYGQRLLWGSDTEAETQTMNKGKPRKALEGQRFQRRQPQCRGWGWRQDWWVQDENRADVAETWWVQGASKVGDGGRAWGCWSQRVSWIKIRGQILFQWEGKSWEGSVTREMGLDTTRALLVYFVKPQFSHLWNGQNNTSSAGWNNVWGDNRTIQLHHELCAEVNFNSWG